MNAEKEPVEPEQNALDFDPADFAFRPATSCWIPPCWIKLSVSFRATSGAARSAFPLPLAFDFKVDAFARRPTSDQFGEELWGYHESLLNAGHHAWAKLFLGYVPQLSVALEDTSTLFKPPLRFVDRAAFKNVTLGAILKYDPKGVEVYLADDTNSYGAEISTLRIHSSLWWYPPGCVWFQRDIPPKFHSEDVLPWFRSMIEKLPRKLRPMDSSPWVEKLTISEPNLTNFSDRLILVFGPRAQIGFAALFHLDRSTLHSLIREGSRILIRAPVPNPYANPEKLQWTFHLFCPTPQHAQRLEARLLSAQQNHFCLGDDICGMIARNEGIVHAVNVDADVVRQLCSKEGQILVLFGPARYRHKSYDYWPADQPLPSYANAL